MKEKVAASLPLPPRRVPLAVACYLLFGYWRSLVGWGVLGLFLPLAWATVPRTDFAAPLESLWPLGFILVALVFILSGLLPGWNAIVLLRHGLLASAWLVESKHECYWDEMSEVRLYQHTYAFRTADGNTQQMTVHGARKKRRGQIAVLYHPAHPRRALPYSLTLQWIERTSLSHLGDIRFDDYGEIRHHPWPALLVALLPCLVMLELAGLVGYAVFARFG